MRKSFINGAIAFALSICLFACNKAEETTTDESSAWKELFNGKDLTGWHKVGGDASYEVKEGVIIGTTVLNTPNTFMVSDEKYGDFILELDLKVDPLLNSGVQIRSNVDPSYKNGRFHGYQTEIDNFDRTRGWSGGIYDEARRGWLYTLKDNEAARNAFKPGEWNTYRIECIGDTIRTFVNGVAASNLVDGLTAEGHFGLQVHGVGDDAKKEGITAMWKNIKIITDPQAIAENATQSSAPMIVYTDNQLTDEEENGGWELLFDGYTLNGWKGAYLDGFPEGGWKIRNGELIVEKSDGGESTNGGDIVTKEQYSNFELKVDFKITEGANSGIKYYVTLNEEGNSGSAFGLEFQILDDVNHPDAKKGRDGNRTIGSLYDMLTAASDKKVNPIGEWNTAHIISNNNHVEYYLNGAKTLEFDRGSEAFRALVAKSKYADPKYNKNGKFGEAEQGHILLQDHGDEVHFKNVKLKKL